MQNSSEGSSTLNLILLRSVHHHRLPNMLKEAVGLLPLPVVALSIVISLIIYVYLSVQPPRLPHDAAPKTSLPAHPVFGHLDFFRKRYDFCERCKELCTARKAKRGTSTCRARGHGSIQVWGFLLPHW